MWGAEGGSQQWPSCLLPGTHCSDLTLQSPRDQQEWVPHPSFPPTQLSGLAESHYSAFISLSFLICKEGLRIPTTERGHEDLMGGCLQILGPVPTSNNSGDHYYY